MKKLFLFLTVLAFGVSFSSCLKMDNSFTDPLNLVYINEHNGAIYGKTQGGRLITNPKFQLMDINSLHLMSYNWDEKQHGTSNIGAATVFNVQLIEEIPITYKDRIEGSVSKLNTYTDGYKVIAMIFALIRDKRPFFYFSSITL